MGEKAHRKKRIAFLAGAVSGWLLLLLAIVLVFRFLGIGPFAGPEVAPEVPQPSATASAASAALPVTETASAGPGQGDGPQPLASPTITPAATEPPREPGPYARFGGSGVVSAAFSADGLHLTVTTADGVWILDSASGAEEGFFPIPGAEHAALDAAWSKLAVVVSGGSIELWDPSLGSPLFVLGKTGDGMGMSAPAFPEEGEARVFLSPDGRYLIAVMPGSFLGEEMLVWDTEENREVLREAVFDPLGLSPVVLSPAEGRLAALVEGAQGTELRIWELPDPEAKLSVSLEIGFALSVSPSGDRLAVFGAEASSGEGVYLIDAFSGEVLNFLALPVDLSMWLSESDPIGASGAVGFTAHGDIVQLYLGGLLVHWDLATGEPLGFLEPPADAPTSYDQVVFSPDGGRLLGLRAGGPPTLEEVDRGLRRVALVLDQSRSAGPQLAASFMEDELTVASLTDLGDYLLWGFAEESGVPGETQRLTPEGWIGRVLDADFSMRGRLLAFIYTDENGGLLVVFDSTAGSAQKMRLDGHPVDLAACPQEPWIAVSTQTGITGWDLMQGLQTFSANPGEHDLWSMLTVSHDCRTLAAKNVKGGITLWEIPSGQQRLVIEQEGNDPLAMALSPDGSRLAGWTADAKIDPVTSEFSYRGQVVLWDAHTGEVIGTSSTELTEERVSALAFSPDGQVLVAGFSQGGLAVWDAYSLEKRVALQAHQGQVNDLAFSWAGDRFASASEDGTILLWDLADLFQ